MGFLDKCYRALFPKRYAKKEEERKNTIAETNKINYAHEATMTNPYKQENLTESFETEVISINPNVFLVGTAAKLSIGKKALESYEDRLEHIQKLMKRGHESILEHSNIVSLIRIPYNKLGTTKVVDVVLDLIDIISKSRYLHVCIRKYENKTLCILIGGSIRGYINTVREVNPYNALIEELFNKIIYQSVEKEFLYDLINSGLLKELECTYRANAHISSVSSTDENGEEVIEATAKIAPDPKPMYEKHTTLLYAQNFRKVYGAISKWGFSLRDAQRVCTVSFLFDSISRSTGNQLVRHRVGITQESQRYVKHTTDKRSDFVNPVSLQYEFTDRYDEETYNKIMTYLKKKDIFAVYKYMISNGIYKEDARAWLPMNVTTKIMMTFTYKQLAKFLELRLDKAAQLEIRNLAFEVQNLIYKKFYASTEDEFISTAEQINEFMRQVFINPILEPQALSNRKESDDEYSTLMQNFKSDEEEDYISTNEVQSNPEDIRSLDINSLEGAEKYLQINEEFKNLKED